MNPRTPVDAELQRRLEAYAEARLSPDPAAVARIRARIMREARTQLEGAAPVESHEPIRIGRVRRARGLRRPAALLLAAALSLTVAGGAALAAQPGGPLYGARLWLEAATLPGAPGPRTEADIKRLGDRVSEIVTAAQTGNGTGVQAALGAYQDIVNDALTAAGTDPTRLTELQDALNHHLTVLQGVLEKVPEQARSGIENAIEKSDNALDKVKEHRTGPPDKGPGPAASPKPDRTPKPQKTPKPVPPEPPNTSAPDNQPDRPAGPPASHPSGPH